ncbi:MAG: hypothetical protein JST58_12145 [Bacteroidetes bacterium]|nr:hypothetical protein [Bacteroidota bacterium]
MQAKNKYITMIVLITAMMIAYKYSHHNWILTSAIVLGILSFLSETAVSYIDGIWMKIAHILGTISNSIILTLIFFLVVVPIGFVKKYFFKKSTDHNSSFIHRSHTYTKEDLTKLW